MTIQEILSGIGLTDEQITSVLESMKKNKVFTASEENLDIRYNKLKSENENTLKKLTEANTLIEQMKLASAGNEGLQTKVSEYEAKIATLTKELADEKLASAIKVGLLSEKATDIDYLTFKLREAGELQLDEKENIKGWDEKIKDLKKSYPNQFESTAQKKIEPNRLNTGENETKLTKAEFLKKPYNERSAIYQQNPEAISELLKS